MDFLQNQAFGPLPTVRRLWPVFRGPGPSVCCGSGAAGAPGGRLRRGAACASDRLQGLLALKPTQILMLRQRGAVPPFQGRKRGTPPMGHFDAMDPSVSGLNGIRATQSGGARRCRLGPPKRCPSKKQGMATLKICRMGFLQTQAFRLPQAITGRMAGLQRLRMRGLRCRIRGLRFRTVNRLRRIAEPAGFAIGSIIRLPLPQALAENSFAGRLAKRTIERFRTSPFPPIVRGRICHRRLRSSFAASSRHCNRESP